VVRSCLAGVSQCVDERVLDDDELVSQCVDERVLDDDELVSQCVDERVLDDDELVSQCVDERVLDDDELAHTMAESIYHNQASFDYCADDVVQLLLESTKDFAKY